MIEALAFAFIAVAMGLPGLITVAVGLQFESQTNRKPPVAAADVSPPTVTMTAT
jgi:hypothetical protein